MNLNSARISSWLARNGYRAGWTTILIAGAIAAAIYGKPCMDGSEVCTGGTLRGITLGFIGSGTIMFSVIYLVRKDRPKLSFLPLKHWLYAHVVIGTLSLIIITFHTGFSLRNTVAVIAYVFLALTVLSGLAGMALFYYLPRMQTRSEASVLIPQDLCRRLTVLTEEITELCKQKGGTFLELHDQLVLPIYRTPIGQAPPSPDVSPWVAKVPPEEQEELFALAAKIENAHDLIVLLGQNLRFKWLIRGWIVLHVPSTIGLIVFAVVHVVSITWYGVP